MKLNINNDIGKLYYDDESMFNRVDFIKKITKIFTLDGNGLVVAINGEWGSGKTILLKMMEKWIIINNDIHENPSSTADTHITYKAVYFSAWEHDFVQDPFLAFIAIFKELFDKQLGAFNELKEKALPVLAAIGIHGIKKIVQFKTLNLINIEKSSQEICKNASKIRNLIDPNIDEIDKYIQLLESIDAFKRKLTALADNKKLIIQLVAGFLE